MSLRRRLLLGCLAVAAVLLAADAALASTFRSYLVGRVDRQLAEAADRQSHPPPGDRGPGPGSPRRDRPFTDFYFGECDETGRIIDTGDGPAPEPSPAQVLDHVVAAGQPIRPFVAAAATGAEWRLAAVRTGTGIAVVGLSLGEMSATLHRMQFVLGAATVAVLLMLGAVAMWVLRQGVRPLAAMTATAGAIAAGDLSERVEHTDERTEAGRLGTALNAMMGRIEEAFAERAAGERRLRRFVADASHELRTPLTSIRGYAELYRRGALEDDQQLADAMWRIEAEAARMGVLVEDLLLLARLDQGRPLDLAPVRLDLLAADAAADARATDPSRAIGLAASEVTVVGDEARLRQVVANLLGNALRHTPSGTPIEMTVGASEGTARLTVADQGPGMDADTAARAFERFFRADPARTSRGGGAGLGLSIVDAVVSAHGGQVRLDTAPGAGARFTVELPANSQVPRSDR